MHAVDSAPRQAGAGVQVQGRRQIAIPDALADTLDRLVDRVSRRTGERQEDVRRGLEIAVLSRGVAVLQSEEEKR